MSSEVSPGINPGVDSSIPLEATLKTFSEIILGASVAVSMGVLLEVYPNVALGVLPEVPLRILP